MITKTHFICPFCFEEAKISQVQFRCTNRRCLDVDDIERTEYENGNVNLPLKAKKTFSVATKNPFQFANAGDCPQCNKTTFKKICPACHNNLPESTLKGKDLILSIIGSRDTGKSHFIAVIIKELIERISIRFDGAVTAFDDTMDRYERMFGRRLYTDLQKLDLTPSSLQNTQNGAYRPFIFSLHLKDKKWFKEVVQTFTLVFFDTAGEDLNDLDTMSTVNKYICKSAGIIFLVDPLQFPPVSTQIDPQILQRASSIPFQQATRPDDILARISQMIHQEQKIASDVKISIPIAIVLSKFDVIEEILPSNLQLLQPSPHCLEQGFVLNDWHNVHSEVHSLLQHWQAESFLSQLELNYQSKSFFAVSALGLQNNPGLDHRIQKPRPHRIEDPLLWLLNKLDILKKTV